MHAWELNVSLCNTPTHDRKLFALLVVTLRPLYPCTYCRADTMSMPSARTLWGLLLLFAVGKVHGEFGLLLL